MRKLRDYYWFGKERKEFVLLFCLFLVFVVTLKFFFLYGQGVFCHHFESFVFFDHFWVYHEGCSFECGDLDIVPVGASAKGYVCLSG